MPNAPVNPEYSQSATCANRNYGRHSHTFLLTMLVLVVTMIQSPWVYSQNTDWSKVNLRATLVSGSVYIIDNLEQSEGFSGGNIAASIGEDGIVLVDAKYEALSDKLLATLKTLTDKPPRFLINTHVHHDHTDGNVALGAIATIIAHANTRLRLARPNPENPDSATPAVALPIITMDDGLMLHQNGEDIRMFHIPRAHTDSDIVIHFQQSNVVHMGDLYFSGMFPFVSETGTVKGMIAGVETVLSQIPANAKIIPGHGPVSNIQGLRDTLAMLKETTAIVQQGIADGQSLEQMQEAKVFAKFEAWSHGYLNADGFMERIHRELVGS